jgi:hypothetical protein
MNRQPFEGDLLLFTKGDYTLGLDKEEVKPGTKFQAELQKLKVGWTYWEGQSPTSYRMGLLCEGYQPERRSELGDSDSTKWPLDDDGEPRDPWRYSNLLVLVKEDDGRLVTFSTNSKGGLSAIGELCKKYDEALLEHPDDDPVIAIGVDSYQHPNRKYGRIKYPTLEIVGWAKRKDRKAA